LIEIDYSLSQDVFSESVEPGWKLWRAGEQPSVSVAHRAQKNPWSPGVKNPPAAIRSRRLGRARSLSAAAAIKQLAVWSKSVIPNRQSAFFTEAGDRWRLFFLDGRPKSQPGGASEKNDGTCKSAGGRAGRISRQSSTIKASLRRRQNVRKDASVGRVSTVIETGALSWRGVCSRAGPAPGQNLDAKPFSRSSHRGPPCRTASIHGSAYILLPGGSRQFGELAN